MKKLSIALINLPLLALGTALAQTPTAVDYDDMLSPLERALNRHPDLYPEWTWMTQGQAALVLKAHGYDFILNYVNFSADIHSPDHGSAVVRLSVAAPSFQREGGNPRL